MEMDLQCDRMESIGDIINMPILNRFSRFCMNVKSKPPATAILVVGSSPLVVASRSRAAATSLGLWASVRIRGIQQTLGLHSATVCSNFAPAKCSTSFAKIGAYTAARSAAQLTE